jgi:hypothetical protein
MAFPQVVALLITKLPAGLVCLRRLSMFNTSDCWFTSMSSDGVLTVDVLATERQVMVQLPTSYRVLPGQIGNLEVPFGMRVNSMMGTAQENAATGQRYVRDEPHAAVVHCVSKCFPTCPYVDQWRCLHVRHVRRSRVVLFKGSS